MNLEEQHNEQDPLRRRIQEVFPDEHTKNKALSLLTSTKPPGWGKKSNPPYYREIYAKIMRRDLESMMQSRHDLVYYYERFCGAHQELMTHQTLYARINQSINYLKDCLDPNHKYSNWLEMCEITRERNLGVCIRLVDEFRVDSDIANATKPDLAIPAADVPRWKREMEDWLENGSSEPFVLEGLILTPDEVVELKKELNELQGIQASINCNKIMIIRMDV